MKIFRLPSRLEFQGLTPRLRMRVLLIFAVLSILVWVVGVMLAYSNANSERLAICNQALGSAVASSFRFDQEVLAVNYLLKGLSTSPALRSGDVKVFYDQLKATPAPEGSWLILQDLEGQVVNTLRPYGAKLPKQSDFQNYQEQIDRIRERRWTVSGRMFGIVRNDVTIALSMRLDADFGEMNGFLTTMLSDKRLLSVLNEEDSVGSTAILFDRNFRVIVSNRSGADAQSEAPGALRNHLAGLGPTAAQGGLIELTDESGVRSLVAYHRSGATNWTTTVQTPLAAVNAPIDRVKRQATVAALILLSVGAGAAWMTARQVEKPLEALSELVKSSEDRVAQLSDQLLSLQEDERKQIARELHDSTAQSIVAATLDLARLRQECGPNERAAQAAARIGEALDTALMELRVFTYLLHPPNLEKEGLSRTIVDFAEGFAARTGLRTSLRISSQVDSAPFEVQRTALRVLQEALGNVQRHAEARSVTVAVKVLRRRVFVRVYDDGRGFTEPEGRSTKLGVGIPGMQARLREFKGDLKIRSGVWGTSVLAVIPLSTALTTSLPRRAA